MTNAAKQTLQVADIKNFVAQVAPSYDVKKVTLFGSYANGEQTQDSDIDLLVEFGDTATYLTVFDFQYSIEEKIGLPVDVIPAPIPVDSILEIGKEVLLYEHA